MHKFLKAMAHPDTIYTSTLATHNLILSRYQPDPANSSNDPAKAGLAPRRETCLKKPMSETDIHHTQKVENIRRATRHSSGGMAWPKRLEGKYEQPVRDVR
ncbi:hypothetical protein D9756_007949 [Leucocoprinus leucothites]|uniref:Uncharacterized protein n=1 Tax=Leucocoprinus leucothites TaxID=201217 RepID=A0A8H5FXF1_9AGAR|nr:hypothetical protein D9756_007949 [Leucoagaricus leucothites]